MFNFLPDGLVTPGLLGVAPQNLSSPPALRRNGSTTSVIIIEWGESPSDIPQSVVYKVQYTLFPLEGDPISDSKIVSSVMFEYMYLYVRMYMYLYCVVTACCLRLFFSSL